MEQTQTKKYTGLLLQKKGELLERGARQLRTLAEITSELAGADEDGIDEAVSRHETHLHLMQGEKDVKLLRVIDKALKRISDGTFGICSDCEEQIAYKRLDATPWADQCAECKAREKNEPLATELVHTRTVTVTDKLAFRAPASVREPGKLEPLPLATYFQANVKSVTLYFPEHLCTSPKPATRKTRRKTGKK